MKKIKQGFIPVVIVAVITVSTIATSTFIIVKNNIQKNQEKKAVISPSPKTVDQISEKTDELEKSDSQSNDDIKVSSQKENFSEKEENKVVKDQTNIKEKDNDEQKINNSQREVKKVKKETPKVNKNIDAKDNSLSELIEKSKEMPKNEPEKKPEAKKTVYVDPPHPGAGFTYIANEVQVTAVKEGNGIRLSWNRCNSDQFVAYKVARSETASDVYFPRDGSIASIPNQDALTYFDTNVESGKTYYYRICSLERNGESWCGNVASVTF